MIINEGMKDYKVIYRKNNGQLIARYRNTPLEYKIGDTTCMGWKVIDIQYLFHGSYYPVDEYHHLLFNYNQKKIVKFLRFLSKKLYNLEKRFS